MGGMLAQEAGILIFRILSEVQPQLGHAEPMGLRFQRRCRAGQSQAALSAGSKIL